MIFKIILFSLLSQAAPGIQPETEKPLPTPEATPPAQVESAPESPKLTNSGEAFQDPFAPSAPAPSNITPSNVPPSNMAPSSSPVVPSGSDPQFEEISPNAPSETVPNGLAPSGVAPPNSVGPIAPPPVKKDFSFPELEEFKGPVTQEVVQKEQNFIGTPVGAWNMGLGIGMGLNINRRNQQVQFETQGGYRLYEQFELGGVVSYRFINDALIGFIFTGNGFFRLTEPPGRRIDLKLGGGLGWTLRAPKTKFTEGRFTLRAQTGLLVYISPGFALTADAALESFIFSVDSNGDSTNLMKGGGAPTQLMLTLGSRWEF